MNNKWFQYSIFFIVIILFQGLVINYIRLGVYAYPMVYITALLMLPFQSKLYFTIIIALILGIGVDALSNTFGLHTSSSLLIVYLRPFILNFIKQRDGYENDLLPSIHDMGRTWFYTYALMIIVIHHLWFFSLEVFRLDLIYLILAKTIVSSVISFGIILILQYIFYKPSR